MSNLAIQESAQAERRGHNANATGQRDNAPTQTPRNIAREILSEHEDYGKAAEALLEMCRDDADLYAVVIGDAELNAARLYIRSVAERDRSATFAAKEPTYSAQSEAATGGSNSRLQKVANLRSGRLLDTTLPGGFMLKNARSSDLNFAADSYKKVALTNAKRARFLRMLGERVGDKSVGEMFSEEQVRVIEKESQRG